MSLVPTEFFVLQSFAEFVIAATGKNNTNLENDSKFVLFFNKNRFGIGFNT